MNFIHKYILLTMTVLFITSQAQAAGACGGAGASSADTSTESLVAAPSTAVRPMDMFAPLLDPTNHTLDIHPMVKEKGHVLTQIGTRILAMLDIEDRKALSEVSRSTSKARPSLKMEDHEFVAMATARPEFFAATEKLDIRGGICKPLPPAIWPHLDSLRKQLRTLELFTISANSRNIDQLATIQWARLEKLSIHLSPITAETATAIIASPYLWKNLRNLMVSRSNHSEPIDGYKLLWNHILTGKDLKLDQESKAFAHRELANSGETPEAHYRAILELGLKAGHHTVGWAREKLYGNIRAPLWSATHDFVGGFAGGLIGLL